MKNINEMTEKERIAAAVNFFATVDEYEPFAMADALSRRFSISFEVASRIVCPTHQTVKANGNGSHGTCHYCGKPAVEFDFFEAPVCKNCR